MKPLFLYLGLALGVGVAVALLLWADRSPSDAPDVTAHYRPVLPPARPVQQPVQQRDGGRPWHPHPDRAGLRYSAPYEQTP